MDKVFTIDQPMTLAAAVQAFASVLAFLVIIFQLWMLIRNIRGATHDRIYAHYMEVCKLLMQKPYLRPYFYDKQVVSDADTTLKAEVEIMSEAIMGLIEHAVVQKRNMPRRSWRDCWKPYAQERLAKSVDLRKFFDQNKEWYTKMLRDEVADLTRGLRTEEAKA